MKKYIKDGMVAVLYSPKYGAGWYSWIDIKEVLFDPDIVQLVLDDAEQKEIEKLAKQKWGDNNYYGGARDLEVMWIPEGTAFRINEYDGWESIETKEMCEWIIA